jgi:RimJ/RimL family protein N-acetyltransferase
MTAPTTPHDDHHPAGVTRAGDGRPVGTASALADAWPVFGLVIRAARLELRLPTDDELVALATLAHAGIHPPEQMPFQFPWTDKPSPQFEREFLQHHWLMRATWTLDDWSLNLGVFLDGEIIGSQVVRGQRFSVYRTVDTGSWLGAAWQGHGHGKAMRSAVLSFVFDGLGARYADSGAFLDNPASNAVSRSLGYTENGRDELAPRGEPRPHQRWRIAAEQWRAHARPPVTVHGLDACCDLFGV